jgi:transcriptional regulator with XRE-family HTH domain
MRPLGPFVDRRDNPLADGYSMGMPDDQLAERLGRNVKQLREARGQTQQQIAKLAGLPRATWANLESGAGNPTLSVLTRVADALQVTLEELVATPRAACAFYPRGNLPHRVRGEVTVTKLLPDAIPGMEIDRLELPPGARMTGIPHTPGTREYLTVEAGAIVLVAAGERWQVERGDVVAFRGDQRHSYANPGRVPAIGYSVVALAKT